MGIKENAYSYRIAQIEDYLKNLDSDFESELRREDEEEDYMQTKT